MQVFNRAAEEGIPLRDKRHPIIRFEKWEQPEHLRGVAAGTPVPMLGSVVINVSMLELGKSTGPDVWMRFKVCKQVTPIGLVSSSEAEQLIARKEEALVSILKMAVM